MVSPKKFNLAFNNDRRQKGAILVISLFMMAMMEVIVIFVLMKYRHSIYDSSNFNATFQGSIMALNTEQQVIDTLLKAKLANKLLLGFALEPVEVDGGLVEAKVQDVQGHFNLNNLINPDFIEPLKQMLTAVAGSKNGDAIDPMLGFLDRQSSFYRKDTDDLKEGMANQDADMDEEDESNTNQANANAKQPQKENVKAKGDNGDVIVPFYSLSEILIVDSINKDLFKTLQNYLTVLPEVTPLNVNTATDYALMSLDPKITPEIAKQIIQAREQQKGFKEIGEFFDQKVLDKIQINEQRVTIESTYYLSRIYVKYRNAQLALYSLFRVEDTEQHINLKVVWRSLNTL